MSSYKKTNIILPILFIGGIIVLMQSGFSVPDEMTRAAIFFLSGAFALTISMLFCWQHLFAEKSELCQREIKMRSLFSLAFSEVQRHSTRTLTCVALMASAAFIVLALGGFRYAGQENLASRESGSGGFDLIAETQLPIFSLPNENETLPPRTSFFACRVRDGDDASCQNLYKTSSPQIIGLPANFLARGGFRFSSPYGIGSAEAWKKLTPVATREKNVSPHNQPRVPIILDESTALYSLHLRGVGSVFHYASESDSLEFEVVALLAGSILQGAILMSEENLLALFPTTSGHRFFLVETSDAEKTARILRDEWREFGVQDETAHARLTRFFSVQNCYIAIFQSLGILGLLLGVVGVALVQFRSVTSRAAAFALMKALGFSERRLSFLILLEVLIMTLLAMFIAINCALIAAAPHFTTRGDLFSFLVTAIFTFGGMGLVAICGSLAALRAARNTKVVILFCE